MKEFRPGHQGALASDAFMIYTHVTTLWRFDPCAQQVALLIDLHICCKDAGRSSE